MRKIQFFSLLFLCVLVSGSLAYAKMTNGKVSSFDPSTRKLTLSSTDVISGKPVSTDIWLDADVSFEGDVSLSNIQAGDNLWVEAEADSEGNLRAAKIIKG